MESNLEDQKSPIVKISGMVISDNDSDFSDNEEQKQQDFEVKVEVEP